MNKGHLNPSKSCLKKQSSYPINDENRNNNENQKDENEQQQKLKSSKGVKLNDETLVTKYTKGTEPLLVGLMTDKKKKSTKISKIASTKVDTSNVAFGMLGTSLFHLDLDYEETLTFDTDVMTMSELRKELKRRGLDSTGATEILRERLESFLMKEMKEKQEEQIDNDNNDNSEKKTSKPKTNKRKKTSKNNNDEEEEDHDSKMSGLETILKNAKPIEVDLTFIPSEKPKSNDMKIVKTYSSKKQKIASV